MPHPPIQLVAIDLDGTLLNDSKQVSDQTADALRCLPARGIHVIIASARPPRSVRAIYNHLSLTTLQINYNGALIWDEPNRQVMFHQPLQTTVVQSIVRHARHLFPETLVSCEIMDRWYTDRIDEQHLTETSRMFPPDVVAPFESFCAQPTSKLMLLGPPASIDQLQSTLQRTYANQATFVRQDPDLLQIVHHGISKAAGVARVAQHYGISLLQVMAIGDAPNDIDMLRSAGVAVAMDNAHPDAKAVAHWVAPSNNDHGVHAALVHFGLCK